LTPGIHSMYKLTFWLSSDTSQSLMRSEFLDKRRGLAIVAERAGYCGGVDRKIGNFVWSSAVPALTVLTLRTAAYKFSANSDLESARFPVLEGAENSLASSLDFALSKQPNWILDMFGQTYSGASTLRKLLRRQNSERKRSGPVQIW